MNITRIAGWLTTPYHFVAQRAPDWQSVKERCDNIYRSVNYSLHRSPKEGIALACSSLALIGLFVICPPKEAVARSLVILGAGIVGAGFSFLPSVVKTALWPKEEFISAVKNENCVKIQAILNSTNNIREFIDSFKSPEGFTPIKIALKNSDYSLALRLWHRMGAEGLSVSDLDSWSLICLACVRGANNYLQCEALKVMEKMPLKALALQDASGDTALISAIVNNQRELAKKLIEKMEPKDLALQNSRGCTALHYAVQWNPELAKKLIEKMEPKDLALQNSYGFTALHSVVHLNRNPELAKKLIDKMSPRDLALQSMAVYTALHSAVQWNPEIATKLIEKMRPEDLAIRVGVLTALRQTITEIENEAVETHKINAVRLIERMRKKDLIDMETFILDRRNQFEQGSPAWSALSIVLVVLTEKLSVPEQQVTPVSNTSG